MTKILFTGLVLYIFYKYMFRPSLNKGKQQEERKVEDGEIEIRRANKNPREERGEFIDYEEVE